MITQSTGFENVLPTGTGLFAFRDMDEIGGAIETIESDYEAACRSARAVAEEYLEATRVCGKLVEDIGLAGSLSRMKFLIINADDFGYGCGVNRAITELHDQGVVTSAGLMVNTPGPRRRWPLAGRRRSRSACT